MQSIEGVGAEIRRQMAERGVSVEEILHDFDEFRSQAPGTYAGFRPARGTVLVRPDPGPDRIGHVFLTDRERKFEGYRKGEVLAVGAAEDVEGYDAPEVGDVVHYDRLRPPPRCDRGVQLGEEKLVLLWWDQVLGVEVRE